MTSPPPDTQQPTDDPVGSLSVHDALAPPPGEDTYSMAVDAEPIVVHGITGKIPWRDPVPVTQAQLEEIARQHHDSIAALLAAENARLRTQRNEARADLEHVRSGAELVEAKRSAWANAESLAAMGMVLNVAEAERDEARGHLAALVAEVHEVADELARHGSVMGNRLTERLRQAVAKTAPPPPDWGDWDETDDGLHLCPDCRSDDIQPTTTGDSNG